MKKSKSIRLGMNITDAFQEMIKADEPTFCNFNSVYLYGGCKTPPHEYADKQRMRTILAGMAMQSLLSSPLWLKELDKRIAEAEQFYPTIATMAVQQADALLKELNKEKEGETSHE